MPFILPNVVRLVSQLIRIVSDTSVYNQPDRVKLFNAAGTQLGAWRVSPMPAGEQQRSPAGGSRAAPSGGRGGMRAASPHVERSVLQNLVATCPLLLLCRARGRASQCPASDAARPAPASGLWRERGCPRAGRHGDCVLPDSRHADFKHHRCVNDGSCWGGLKPQWPVCAACLCSSWAPRAEHPSTLSPPSPSSASSPAKHSSSSIRHRRALVSHPHPCLPRCPSPLAPCHRSQVRL